MTNIVKSQQQTFVTTQNEPVHYIVHRAWLKQNLLEHAS